MAQRLNVKKIVVIMNIIVAMNATIIVHQIKIRLEKIESAYLTAIAM